MRDRVTLISLCLILLAKIAASQPKISLSGMQIGMPESQILEIAQKQKWGKQQATGHMAVLKPLWIPPDHLRGEHLKIWFNNRKKVCRIQVVLFSVSIRIGAHEVSGVNARSQLLKLLGKPSEIRNSKNGYDQTYSWSQMGLSVLVPIKSGQICSVDLKEIETPPEYGTGPRQSRPGGTTPKGRRPPAGRLTRKLGRRRRACFCTKTRPVHVPFTARRRTKQVPGQPFLVLPIGAVVTRKVGWRACA